MKQKIKIVLENVIIVILAGLLIVSGLAVYHHNRKTGEVNGNPLDWSVDTWDGASISSEDYLADYGNRGKDTITIESAQSFIYFIEQVNTGNDYEGKTVYLNSNIDLAGYTINSIGNLEYPFKGIFDGSYYTIMNANVNGMGLFGYTENAVIKNLGLYNVNIVNDSVYTGGLIGEAYNTSIENSFFRQGSITGKSYVGGLVGLFETEETIVTISNSFADTTLNGLSVGGIIGRVRTNGLDNSLVKLEEVYYTTGKVYAEIDNPSNYLQSKVIKPTSLSNFSSWDYGVSKTSKWVNYSYAEYSNKLNFNYPILNQYVKVYTLGACYENVLYNPTTGEAENIESLTKAIENANDLRDAEINIIVSKVTLDKTATLTGITQLKINAVKDTVISRGDNTDSLIIGLDHSKIVLGDTVSDAKLIIDGNRKTVEDNNLKSGALIQANNIEINQNVVLQNNVNNSGNGGAIVLTNDNDVTLKGIQIINCSASKGGAIYVSNESTSSTLSLGHIKNITIDDDVLITNCTAEQGGALYVEGNVNLTIADNIFGNNAKIGKDIYFTDKSTVTLTKDLTNNLSLYINNLQPYEEVGRTDFDESTICYGDNLSENIDKLILENDGLKTTNVLRDNVISAYNGTEYNITYNTNGGIHSNPESYTCVDNIILGEATKDGYEFLGWKEVKSTTLLASNLDEEYVTEITTGTLGDKEYEAEYQASTAPITISFTKGGNFFSASTDVSTVEINTTTKVGLTINVKSSYSDVITLDYIEVSITDQSNTSTNSVTTLTRLDPSDGFSLGSAEYFNITPYYYDSVKEGGVLIEITPHVSQGLAGQITYDDDFVGFYVEMTFPEGHYSLNNVTQKPYFYDYDWGDTIKISFASITKGAYDSQPNYTEGFLVTDSNGVQTAYYGNLNLVFDDNYYGYHIVAFCYPEGSIGYSTNLNNLATISWSSQPTTYTNAQSFYVSFNLTLFDFSDEITVSYLVTSPNGEIIITDKTILFITEVSTGKYSTSFTYDPSTYSDLLISITVEEVIHYNVSYSWSYDSSRISIDSNSSLPELITPGEYFQTSVYVQFLGAYEVSSITAIGSYRSETVEIINSNQGSFGDLRVYVFTMSPSQTASVDSNFNVHFTIKTAPAVEEGDGTTQATVNYNSAIDENISFNWINSPNTVTAGSTVTFSWSATPNSGFKIASATIEILSKNGYSYLYGTLDVTGSSSYTWTVPNGENPPRLTSSITVRIVMIEQDISVTSLDYFEFSTYGNGYSVRQKYGVTLPEDVVIPNTYNGKPIVAIIGESNQDSSGSTYYLSAFSDSNVKTIVIPETVTYIGTFAFDYCESLETINIPSGVTYIGDRAFRGCKSLQSIAIPKATTTIQRLAFWRCDSLTRINVDAENPNYTSVDGVLMTKDKKTIITFPAGKASTQDNPYTIPSYVTTVKEYAFSYNQNLEYIVIPNTITSMEQHAFEGCYNMKYVVWNGKNLSWTDYYKYPCWFNVCGRDSEKFEVIVNEDVTNFTFEGSYITHLTINKNVTYIGAGAFEGGRKLTYLYYDAEIASFLTTWSMPLEGGSWSAYDAHPFDTISDEGVDVVIGPNAKVIPNDFLYYSYEYWRYNGDDSSYLDTRYGPTCKYVYDSSASTHNYYQLLNSVDLSNATSLIKIGAYAFSNCTNLTELVIPENVMYIDQYAFDGCEGLRVENGGSVTFEDLNNWRYVDYYSSYDGFRDSKSLTLPDNATATTYLTSTYADKFWLNDPYWFLVFVLDSVNVYYIQKAYTDTTVTNLVLPETRLDLRTMKEYPVKQIGRMETGTASYDDTCIGVALPNLTTLTIPACYTSIGAYAFYGASRLRTVTFEEGSLITTINDYVFAGCSSITAINLPTTIQSINQYAFQNALNNYDLDLSVYTNLTRIAQYAFYNSGIISLKLPDSITTLGDYAFAGSKLIEFNFNLPNVTAIPRGLLYNCTKLTTLTVGEKVTSIGYLAFAGCTSLTTLNWNAISGISVNNSTSYNRYIFANAGAPTGINIKIGPKVTSIPNYFMYNIYLGKPIPVASIDFINADALTTIYSYAFYDNSLAGELNFNSPNALTINNYAFYSCDNITKISGNIGSIGESGFGNCDNLLEVDLQNLTSIGNRAFDNNNALTTVTCTNVESIGTYAFEDCSSLTYIYTTGGTWYRSSTLIGEYGGESEEEAEELAEMVLKYYNYNLVKKELFNYELTSDGNAYVVLKGKDISFVSTITIPTTYNGKSIVAIKNEGFKGCTTLTSVTIPASITEIGDYAFSGCTNLKTVTLGSNVGKIGSYAFSNCKLSTITIPASVNYIGAYAFDTNSNLSSVYFTDANYWMAGENSIPYANLSSSSKAKTYLTSTYVSYVWTKSNSELIFTEVTNGTTKSYYVSINPIFKATIENVVIPSTYNDKNVTGVSASGFKDCINLKTITLPTTIKTLGNYAFQGCTSLTKIDLNSISSLGTYAFDGCASLSSVNATNCTFTSISNYAFQNCTSLTSFDLPDSVTSIGQYAFANSGLNSFNTNNVTSMYKNAFDGCNFTGEFVFNSPFKTFTSVVGGSNVLFKDTTIKKLVFNDTQLTSISASLFKDNTGLKEVEFIDGKIYQIEKNAFEGCTNLTKVTISNYSGSYIYIREFAFSGCTNLAEINLPEKLYTIEQYAFANSGLKTVTIGENISTLAVSAFSGCTRLESVVFNNQYITTLNKEMFKDCTSLTNVDLTNSKIATIGQNAFENCTSLTTFKHPSTLKYINAYAFSNCGFVDLVIPSTVISFGNYAYSNNVKLKSVDFSQSSLLIFPSKLFTDCTNLSSVTLGLNLTTIDVDAFNGCSGLTYIKIPDNVYRIGKGAFANTGLITADFKSDENTNWAGSSTSNYSNGVLIPHQNIDTASERAMVLTDTYVDYYLYSADQLAYYEVKDDFENLIGYSVGLGSGVDGSHLTNINIPDTHNDLPIIKIHNFGFEDCTSLIEINIPLTVTEIGDFAFYGCTSLKLDLTKLTSLETIGAYAFRNCDSLPNVLNFSSSVTTIRTEAFYGCDNITTINISENVKSIETSAFSNCTKLTTINVDDSNTNYCDDKNVALYNSDKTTILQYAIGNTATTYKIVSTTTVIEDYSFNYAKNLTSVTSDDNFMSLKTIGWSAFEGCSKLKTFNIAENSALNYIDGYAFADCNLTTIIIPENVTEIYSYAYSGNKSTSNIYYYGKNTYLYGSEGVSDYFDGGQFAYVGKYSNVTVTFGAQVECIPDYLFLVSTNYNDTTSTTIGSINPNITKVIFEEGCVCSSIGQYAFRFLKNLWSINLQDLQYLTSIGKYAFRGDIGLPSISLPESLAYIGNGAFEYCNYLNNVYFGNNVYNWVAGSTSLSSDSLSNSQTAANYLKTTFGNVKWYREHDYLRFSGNTVYIKTGYEDREIVEIPSVFNGYTITHIGNYGFDNMPNLKTVVLPSTITTIGSNAFQGCAVLEDINLSNVGTINEYAFQNCTTLTNLELPKIQYIYQGAFKGCTGLKTVDIGSSLKYSYSTTYQFNVNAFEGCTALTAINVSEDNSDFASVDGVLFNKGETILLLYPSNKAGTSYEMPIITHTIDCYAFSDTKNLTTLTLSNALNRIGQYAFKNSSVTTLNNLDTSVIAWYRTTDSNYVNGSKVSSFTISYLKSYSSYYYYRNDTSIFEFVHYGYETYGWEVSIKEAYRNSVTSIIIPSTYTGTGYSYSDYYGQYSTTVTMDVCYIYDFRNCPNLEYVYIPNTITSFRSVDVYENKERKIYGSFEGCTKLKTIYIDSNFVSNSNYEYDFTNFVYRGEDIFGNCGTDTEGIEIIFSENITRIPAAMFQIITDSEKSPTTANITKVTYMGDNSLTIGDYAFAGLTTLTEFSGFEYVASVGEHAFDGCSNLGNIDLSNATTIEAYAFNNCSSITDLDLSNAQTIGERAFANCIGVTTLEVNSSSIGEAAFNGCSSVEELTIGEKIRFLPNSVFANMSKLNVINFNAINLDNYYDKTNAYLGELYYGAMIEAGYTRPQSNNIANGLRGLASNNYVLSNAGNNGSGITLNIGPNVTRIPANMFCPSTGGAYAPNITNIVWSNNSSCLVIGTSAFRWLKNLTDVTIPESIQYIGDMAFYDCLNLATINFNATNCADLNAESYGDSETWGASNYAFHNVGKNIYNESTGNGVTVNIGEKVTRLPANLFYSTRADASFTIRLTELNVNNASSLKVIGENALYDAHYLKAITIPESVTTIGNYAFYNAINITSFNFNAVNMNDLQDLNYVFSRMGRNNTDGLNVIVGQGVKNIPAYLLCPDSTVNTYMPNVKSVVFGANSSLETIGKYAFRYCEDMLSVDLENCEKLTSIGDWAFRGCINLEEIYIPKSIKTLGIYAFGFTYRVNKITFDASYMNDLDQENYLFQDAGTMNGTGKIDVVMGYNVGYVPSWLFISAKSQIKTIQFTENRPYWGIIFKQNSLRGLTSVEELEIPSNTTAIQPNAFYGMTGLKTIYFNARSMNDLLNLDWDVTKANSAFAYVGNKVFYNDYDNVINNGGELVKTGNGITVYIGANVERLPASLFFSSSSSLETVIPKIKKVIFDENCNISAQNLSHRVFDRLFFLESVENFENLHIERLGDYTFNQCYSLTSITLPRTLKNIGLNAFRSCKNLNIDLLANTPELRRINNYAFYGCESLTEITIPVDVNYLGNNAFEDCFNLRRINWNVTLEKYDEYYIADNNLKSLNESDNIFLNAGRDAEYLQFITSEKVEYIPGYLFYECEYLTEAFLDNAWEIGEYAFYGCGLTNVSIMAGDWIAKNENNIYYINFTTDNAHNVLTKTNKENSNCYADYTISNSMQFVFTLHDYEETNKDGSTSTYYYYSVRAGRGLKDISHAIIPSEYEGYPVTHIEENGFAGFSNLYEITIPESITSIGYNAFANCSNLRVINYNAVNVKTTYDNLFYNSGTNGNLTLIIGENVESIPDNFLLNIMTVNYEYDTYLYATTSNVTEIVFKGNKLKSIGSMAFAGCVNLTSLTIPASVTYIGRDLFHLNYDGFYKEIQYYIDDLILTFENVVGWNLVNGYGSKIILGSDFFSDSNSILSKFISLNSYEYTGSENYWDSYGYAFERGSDEIEFILDHGENATSDSEAIYYSRYNSSYWFSDKSLSEESIINKVEVPENTDEELVFMGYFYNEVKIIDGNGNIIVNDMTSLIDLTDFNNSYVLVAKWETMEAVLSADNTTIEYNSTDESVLTAKVCNNGSEDIASLYDIDITYTWYRNGVVVDGVTSSSYTHESTTLGVGSYTYKVEASILGKVIISNEVVINVTYGLLDKPTLSPTTFEYDGNAHIPQITGFNTDKMEFVEGYELVESTEVGVYVVRIQLKDNYAWNYDESESVYNRDNLDLIWSITGFKVTLQVDDTYSNGKLSYTIGNNEYSTDNNNEFIVISKTTTITATADQGYGFYYYTIEGKTIKTTVYNTLYNESIRSSDNNDAMFVAKFDLENITEDVIVTGYFAPVITLNLKIEKEKAEQGLKSYNNLITGTYSLINGLQQNMRFVYIETAGDSLVATANVFAIDTMVYIFSGTSDELTNTIEESYDVVSKLTFVGYNLINSATMSVNATCRMENIINDFEAGGNYDVVYEIIEVVSVKDIESNNEIANIIVTPSDPSDGVRIAGDMYVKPEANVGISVINIAEGYTFVGFKSSSSSIYLYNDPNLGYQEITAGTYNYSFTIKNSMSALVIKNFTDTNAIDVQITSSATLQLTHNQSLLKYSLDNSGITFESNAFATMMQGEYTLSGLTEGTVTVILYDAEGNEINSDSFTSGESYTFTINDSTAKVSIIVK